MPVTDGTLKIVAEHVAEQKPDWARTVERLFKVPVVAHLWPREYWLACLVGPFPNEMEGALQPDDDEIRMIASYIDFKLENHYIPSYVEQVRALPLPLVAGHNTVIFLKREDGWGYRRQSWETGTWPHAYKHSRDAKNLPDHPLTLVEVLDHIETLVLVPSPYWLQWKLDHPDVFKEATT